MILSLQDGIRATTPEQAQQAQAAGYTHCPTLKSGQNAGQPCNFWFSPQTAQRIRTEGAGYYTCPFCRFSYDLDNRPMALGVPEEQANANYEKNLQGGGGGATHAGMTPSEQGDIGEDLVHGMGEIPGYGPITWWHPGGASANSPLDGTLKDWGIEVKTVNYDAKNHRFAGGKPIAQREKDAAAAAAGFKGVLGVLVLLDYRRSVADIFVKELPRMGSFYSHTAQQHLVKEIPFHNPFLDPASPTPVDNAPEIPSTY